MRKKIDPKKRVYVYRNLRTGTFSVRQSGLVVNHVSRLVLRDAKYLVSQKGRQRVLDEKRKNVHAGISGYTTKTTISENTPHTKVTYNPYQHKFFIGGDGKPVFVSEFVLFINNEVRALTTKVEV